MRNVGEVFSSSFFSVGKKSMQRLGKNGIARFYVTFHTKSSHSNATAAASPSNFHFSLSFQQHSQPSSMFLSQHQQAFNIDFFGVSSSTVCDVILFYTFFES